ncbi:hypothetical protein ILUMI_17083 [Ignelater luminosus]|uniref:Uncharacterized protein n=1 Tax=Ignelater luminosus TaxID=2038154 RepID=A0A8K0CT32_IGNLU|nr:hypothetical protein ILUMI_17083 [Ignelater luminosus]
MKTVLQHDELWDVVQPEGVQQINKQKDTKVLTKKLLIFDNEPNTPICHLSQQVGLSPGKCHTIGRKDLHYKNCCLMIIPEDWSSVSGS